MIFKILYLEHGWRSGHDNFESRIDRPRHMFVTQSMVLAGKVRKAYEKMDATLSGSSEILESPSDPTTQGLFDKDEEARRSGEYPKKYSDLTDQHFPFFVTLDQVC